MTREEVVRWLESLRREIGKAENRTLWHYAESIDMAIKALKEKNQSDSLVTDSSDACKESESKLDLISRQDAIDTVIRECEPICDAYDNVVTEINSLPSAEAIHKPDYSYEAGMVRRLKEALSAEAVEVVRCKDCKNWYGWEHGTGSCHRSENGYNWFGVDATDYCSFGERKGGESDE